MLQVWEVRTPMHAPCRIFDAKGEELTYVTAADETTGFVEQLKRDKHGEFIVENGALARTTSIRPAPLRFEFNPDLSLRLDNILRRFLLVPGVEKDPASIGRYRADAIGLLAAGLTEESIIQALKIQQVAATRSMTLVALTTGLEKG